MITVAEVPEFRRHAARILSESDRQDIVSYLAAYPKAGVLIRGTGGVRKLRWRRGGTGKRGGVRIIYFYHSEGKPLYLLTLFSKSERAGLSGEERNELRKLTRLLVQLCFEK